MSVSGAGSSPAPNVPFPSYKSGTDDAVRSSLKVVQGGVALVAT